MNKSTVAALVLLLTPVVTVSTSTSAGAAPAGKAPSCVKTRITNENVSPWRDKAVVRNRCAKTKKVRVVWQRPDNSTYRSSCRTLKKGVRTVFTERRNTHWYVRTVTC